MGVIEDLRLFVKVVESGGIARAAKEMNIAKSAVSRRLGQLEERYNVRLIDRQPRNWAVTTAGLELYQRASAMVSDADDLDEDFMQAGHALKGPLSVSIAREFGMSFLKPVLFHFISAHPEIDLTIDFDDRTIDLESENVDLAVRITASALTGLNCHRLGTTRHGLFCSPTYAEQAGLPDCANDLAGHELLHYGTARRARWEFEEMGKKRTVEFRPALYSNDGSFLLDAALNDLGITRLPCFVVARHVKDGALVRVLPDLVCQEYGIFMVYSAKRRLNKRMRALMSVLGASCASLEHLEGSAG